MFTNFDITHCDGGECPLRTMCHRYTQYYNLCATQKKIIHVSKFATPPYKFDKGKVECDMFWGDSAQYLLGQLKTIFHAERSKPKKAKAKRIPSRRKVRRKRH